MRSGSGGGYLTRIVPEAGSLTQLDRMGAGLLHFKSNARTSRIEFIPGIQT